MRKQIEFLTPTKKIVELAKKNNAKYVVIWNDHYRGNSKGFYKNIDSLEKTGMRWNVMPDDRGAIKVFITDENVPELIEQRRIITHELERLRFEKSQNDRKAAETLGYPDTWIDGRWSEKNPKYIQVMENKKRISELVKKWTKKQDKKMQELQNELNKTNTDGFVSRSMWECNI